MKLLSTLTRPALLLGTFAAVALAGACGGNGDSQAATTTGASSSSSSTGGGGGTGGATGGGGTGGSGGDPTPKCSAKETMLVKQTNIDDVAINDTDIFFTMNDGMAGSVSRVPIRGGKAVELTPSPMPIGLAINQDVAIFGDENGGIFSVPLAGGTKKKLGATSGAPGHLVIDATTVYFSDDDGTKSVPIAGGAVKTLTDEIGFSLAVDGKDLIIADFGGGRLLRVPTAGGNAKLLADMQSGPLYPIVIDQNLVWIDAGDLMTTTGTVMRLTGGSKPTTIAMGQSLFRPHGMVYDGTNFYVTADANPPNLVKVPAAGGVAVIVEQLSSDAGLAVDGECLYVADPARGLVSIAK